MLPALVLFRPYGRDLQGRGAFLNLGLLIPSKWNVIASLAFFMPIRDADSYQRKPKKMSRRIRFRNYPKAQNPHYILLLWTIRAGRSCRKVLRGRTSVFGPGSGGTPSRRTIRRGGRHRLTERHVQSRIPDAAGRHCAGSGP